MGQSGISLFAVFFARELPHRDTADAAIDDVVAEAGFDGVCGLSFGGQTCVDQLRIGVLLRDVLANCQNAGDVGVLRQLGSDGGGFGQDLVQRRAAVDVHGAGEGIDGGDTVICRGTETGGQQVCKTFLASAKRIIGFTFDRGAQRIDLACIGAA